MRTTRLLNLFLPFKNRVQSFRISTKITLYYSILLIITVTVSAFLYQKVYLSIMANTVEGLSKQVLDLYRYKVDSTIGKFINFAIETENKDFIQKYLSNNGIQNYQDENNTYSYFNKLLRENASINSIHLLDNNGNTRCSVNMSPSTQLELSDVRKSSWYNDWYKKDIRNKEKYIISLNTDEIFLSKPDFNSISLIRIIYNQNKEQIGILIFNISDIVLKGSLYAFPNNSDEGIVLFDKRNNYITLNKSNLNLNELKDSFKQKNYPSSITVNGKKYTVSNMDINRFSMKLMSIMPLTKGWDKLRAFTFITFMIIIIYCIMVFIGSLLISRTITKPLEFLVISMKRIEKKEFKTVDIKLNSNNEISKLKEVYNFMILKIQDLLHLEKQKTQLDILQMQIKPHFLYNTIDAIRYLSLTGRNDQVNEALEALGSYYRTSLSKGNEIITLDEEISIVKDYLTLIKLRCGDIFSVTYDIDEDTKKCKILKLVLQPLVENAVFHGIQPTGEKGSIKISVKSDFSYGNIIITVEDDGVGMDSDTLKHLTGDFIDKNSSSFGLKGTIKRLQFFYGTSDIYSIESQKGLGTKITLKIPTGRE